MEQLDDNRIVCRLCLQKDGFMFGIFNYVKNGSSMQKKITECTGIKLFKGDGLPSVICHRCLYKVEFSLEFRQQCLMADAALKTDPTAGQLDILACSYPHLNFLCPNPDVIMVVDPTVEDYNSDQDQENQAPNEIELESPTATVSPSARNTKNSYGISDISVCRFCDQAFMNEQDCRGHEINAHNMRAPFACHICYEEFVDRVSFLTHLKGIHKQGKPFKCPQCPRNFARRSDLRKHTIVHTGIKPFTCKVCHKSFSRNTSLSKHMRTHSAPKLVSCRQCHRKFASKAELAKHSIHHAKILKNKKPQSAAASQEFTLSREIFETKSDSEFQEVKSQVENEVDSLVYQQEMPLTDPEASVLDEDQLSNSSRLSDYNTDYDRIMCGIAQADYANQIQEDNSKVSRPFSCKTCKKSFIRKRELDRHITTHTGMKPYKCNRCDKGFGRKDKLVRHMKIHDTNRNCFCDTCGEAFNNSDSLLQHMNYFHSDM